MFRLYTEYYSLRDARELTTLGIFGSGLSLIKGSFTKTKIYFMLRPFYSANTSKQTASKMKIKRHYRKRFYSSTEDSNT